MSFSPVSLRATYSGREKKRERDMLKQLLGPNHSNNEQSKNNNLLYKSFLFYRFLFLFFFSFAVKHMSKLLLLSLSRNVFALSLSHRHTHTQAGA